MKYWKEKEKNPLEEMEFWTGTHITKLAENEIFLYGSNPQGINGAGAAKAAMSLSKGAKNGIGRGFNGSNAYALVTKSLNAGFVEKATGILYDKEGYCSVSPEQIRANVDQLYEIARSPEHKNKKFLVSYQYEAWPNGTPKKSLNGYTSQEMLEMFVKDKEVPPNIVFHDSYKIHLEKILKNTGHTKINKTLENEFNISDNLIVVSPRDNVTEGFTIINTTSQDKSGLGKKFSPFYLSNIELYEGQIAKNMENAWQFSKVYKEFADDNGNPSEEYFKWAKKGWNDSFAHRYANGKGNVPLYSFWKTYDAENNTWQKHKLDYVTARKNIYFPLYAKAIINTPAFQELEQRLQKGEKIALWDFDGYDHAAKGMTYEDVVNSSQYKCGHAFVLYGLLTKQLKLINDELVFDFKNEIIMNKKETSEQKMQEYTYFFQATSPFSQWHPSLFTYKELDFICAEQFMMYAKAKTFGDDTVADKIINIEKCYLNSQGTIKTEYGNFKTEADKACYDLIIAFKAEKINRTEVVSYKNLNTWKTVQGLIKKLGREVSNYNDVVWNSKRKSVVSVASREKYNQNPDLKEILMNTNETIMVEASPYDKIWGIGLSEADAKKITPEKWPGLNLLGEILTDLKDYYRNELNNSKKMKM